MAVSTVAIEPPASVVRIAATLEAAGFEAWCVGGAVRDALLGQADLDWDLATSATPAEVKRLFPRTVPVGIEHGTIGVFGSDGRLHEVTTFRADVETDGRHAVVKFGVSLEEDLARRDLTINAMAWSPSRKELRDPFGGQADLDARLVRAVGDADRRMAEDRLRALRAIRFAARFDFAIAPETWDAIVGSAPSLTRLSVERVYQEWTKTLEQVQAPSRAFLRWRDSGALAVLLPSLADVPEVFVRAVDHVPLPGATMRAERRALRTLTRLAVPFVTLGGRGAKTALQALRASNQEMAFASAVAESWQLDGATLTSAAMDGRPDAVTMRRAVSRIGRTRVHGTLRVFAAIWAAQREAGLRAPTSAEAMRLSRTLLRMAFRDPIALGDLAVTGDDLRAAGVRPGPQLGRILHVLLEQVLQDPTLNTHDALLRLARQAGEES